MMNIEIKLAEEKVKLNLRLKETRYYFGDFITEENCKDWDVRVEDEDILRYPMINSSGKLNPFLEAYLLLPRVSNFLLNRCCALIHGVSFVWHEKSWLITAPSGTGKTTQLHHWMSLYNEEIELINGDKTVLSVKNNHYIMLYPSPWMGKELEAGNAFAPLGGIIVLRQAEKNHISKLEPRKSVLEIYQQFLNWNDTAQEIRAVGKLTDIILKSVPIWLLENRGDEDSAILTYQTLSKYSEEQNENN